jgi:hypothetical protein
VSFFFFEGIKLFLGGRKAPKSGKTIQNSHLYQKEFNVLLKNAKNAKIE